MKDHFGLQSPEGRDAAKTALQLVVAAHKIERRAEVSKTEELARLRQVHAEEKAKYDANEAAILARIAERDSKPPVEEPAPVVEAAPAPDPVPAVDLRDGTWIEVRVPEFTTYRDNGDKETGKAWVVATGRYISTWRKRVASDGDAPFIFEAPRVPAPEPTPTLPPYVWFSEERARHDGGYASVESNRARHQQENNAPHLGSRTPGSLVR